jgi:serine/threonine-protein kinase
MLAIGAKLGSYEVVGSLGAGGMGEVYRARDTKLGRDVAIKVLPEALATDADRIARFEREARALAALNNPRIATLHGMEESAGRHFLVMELVEGETLADRLQRRALALDDALTLALQIAEALDAAHEKGVVHRDLKPANIKITPDDSIKVLDFGLARLGGIEPDRAQTSLTRSPTLSMMATQAGVILGTASYMSPEQAKGLAADHRSDIFTFGIVLYEMLTGRQPFHGETAPDVMAAILARAPDLNALPVGLNPRLSELIARCLEKNPKKRWQAAGDLRLELEKVAAAPRAIPPAGASITSGPTRIVPIAAAALASAAITSAVWFSLRPQPPPAAVTRFTLTLPAGQQLEQNGLRLVAISPDGTKVAYYAGGRLFVRSFSEPDARALASSTNDAPIIGEPVFSPDGESLAFWVGTAPPAVGTIKRLLLSGGTAVAICEAVYPGGMSWDQDAIFFVQPNKGIMRVASSGGQPELVVPIANAVAWGPQLLPDGNTLLFTLATSIATIQGATTEAWDKAHIVARSLKTGVQKTIAEGLGARFVPTGHIVYAVSGVLFAVPFDARRLEVTGPPAPVVDGVRRPLYGGAAPGSVYFSAAAGALMYVPGPAVVTAGQASLTTVDTAGTATISTLPPGPYSHPRFSPDGRLVAFSTSGGRERNVFIYDLAGASTPRQLTFAGRNQFAIWSPDGRRVAFQSDRDGDVALFSQLADGTGPVERLTKPEPGVSHVPASWSPDGKTILFDAIKDSQASLWMLSLEGLKTARFSDVQSTTATTSASFSHDGRWVAYVSVDANRGSTSIFVQPFPPTGSRYRIGAGLHPLWSPDDKALSYVTRIGAGIQSVSISTQPTLTVGTPVSITQLTTGGGSNGPRAYDRTPDGSQFVFFTPGAIGSPAQQIQIVLNWSEELKQRVPTR